MIALQPPLDVAAAICVEAWQVLDSERPLGMRPMPVPKAEPVLVPFAAAIPYRAIRAFARDRGLSRQALRLLVDVIGRLDAARSEREANDMKRKASR